MDSCNSFEDEFEALVPIDTYASLPFDPNSIQDIILTISDRFNFRVVFGKESTRKAVYVGTGLALAGTLIGRHFGGKIGAAVGGAVGGACGVGLVVLSLRDAWDDIKAQLSEVFEIVYDYLANLGIDDYVQAAMFLATHATNQTDLAKIILQIVSTTLGKQVLSTLA